ncbi:MAG: leucine-rich repeat domain-containing protein [Verrucomicrobiae bacterium]|nr:leucine-rich repeat domain-containing protein [Verrucomicrobiae bacterium]
MNRLKSPDFWLTFVCVSFIVVVLVLSLWNQQKINSYYFSQDGLRYRILTKNTDDKTGTVSIIGYQKDRIGNALEIPSTVSAGGVTYSVTTIGEKAFESCTNLASLTIPDNVTHIEWWAFENNTGLTNLIIGRSVTSIGGCGFGSCENLKSIEVDKENQSFANVDGVLYCKDMTLLVGYPGGKEGKKYIIPDSVTNICALAFANCTSLTNLIIGKNVTFIGERAFDDCTNLKAIYFKGGPPHIVFSDRTDEEIKPVLYYIEGTPGWRTPIWIRAGYKTKTWTPEP